jgi:hypothetical protein
VTLQFNEFASHFQSVRASVFLHDEHPRHFLVVWKLAEAPSLVLPETDDRPTFLETPLRAVFAGARGLRDLAVHRFAAPGSGRPHHPQFAGRCLPPRSPDPLWQRLWRDPKMDNSPLITSVFADSFARRWKWL